MFKDYIKNFINSRTYVFRDNKLTHLKTGNAAEQVKQVALVLVGSQYIVEINSFFKVKKYKELTEAAKYFAEQNKPFNDYQYWLVTNKVNNGYFVTFCFIQNGIVNTLRDSMKSGGLVLPERVIAANFIKEKQVLDVEGETFIWDVNYALRYAQYNNPLINIACADYEQVTLSKNTFNQTLLMHLDWRKFAPYLNKFKFSERNKPKITVGNLLNVTAAVTLYLMVSSAYLYLVDAKVSREFEKNKELITSVKKQRGELKELENKVSLLSAPFKDYREKYKAFSALPLSTDYELTSIVINNDDIGIRGSAKSATELFQALAEHEQLKNVEYRTPVRRIGEQDLFSISFNVVN
ncbi:hypothetical protein [Pseudoalteromonas sp. MMG024]|uniref:hypothetical protein n=1 Tax=Pseudoalteromonas sp. MMG024 TaxID=2909980 RepID=UPI001F405520|nr:hypothetical protein [Pseudoalteromonas sp. MMG024]MCF6457529.1 hypothetical protein [Pseudoalteromonas sp. MMG024]